MGFGGFHWGGGEDVGFWYLDCEDAYWGLSVLSRAVPHFWLLGLFFVCPCKAATAANHIMEP